MAIFFLDSSALLKRYVSETGTSWIQSLFDPALANRLAIGTISAEEDKLVRDRQMLLLLHSPRIPLAVCGDSVREYPDEQHCFHFDTIPA